MQRAEIIEELITRKLFMEDEYIVLADSNKTNKGNI